MARPLRIQYEGAVYHVTTRGNARKAIFKDDQDRLFFLDTLYQVNQRYHWLCHAYCLMDNHYHLVIETPEGNLSKGMRQLNGVYTQGYNRRHGRVGHLFQGRYKAIVVEKESHLLEVCRYVVLNPLRAKTVRSPRQWRWSSYRSTVGLESPHACLSVDWVLGQLASDKGRAQKRYGDLVRDGTRQESIWDQVRGQSFLGRETFVETLGPYLKDFEKIKEIPRSQRYLNRPELSELFADANRVSKARRDRVMTKAVEAYGYSEREVGDYLGLHYSTISRVVNRERKKSKFKT